MSKENEEVLVVKTEKLFPAGIWEGFREYDQEEFINLVNENKKFIKRGIAESDESFQQVIAQIILKIGSKIFMHRIPATGGESRLHDMWPIFLGGHIDKSDSNIESAFEREFSEEIDYKGKILSRFFWGVVKLHDNPVNKVHVGLVWIYEGDSEIFLPTKDDGLLDGKFVEIKDLENLTDSMTYWSKIVAPHLINRFTRHKKNQ